MLKGISVAGNLAFWRDLFLHTPEGGSFTTLWIHPIFCLLILFFIVPDAIKPHSIYL